MDYSAGKFQARLFGSGDIWLYYNGEEEIRLKWHDIPDLEHVLNQISKKVAASTEPHARMILGYEKK